MQPHVTFHVAAPSDAEELAALRIEAMRESLERIGRFDAQRARTRFLSGFSPEHTRLILLAGQRIGFFVVRSEEGLWLDHLYIKPGHQGLGVGAIVLADVFSRADTLGCPVRVGALRESDSNRFYVRHGFVLFEQAEFDNYYVRHAGTARLSCPRG